MTSKQIQLSEIACELCIKKNPGHFGPGRFGQFLGWVVSALSRFGRISIETEVVYGKDRGGCCWWGMVGPISIGIETNERNDR